MPRGDVQRAVVGRPLDEDARARVEQQPGEEREALERAVRDQHLARLDAVPLGDPLAERLVAGDRAVVENGRPVALDRRARAVGELLDRQGLGRRDAARERDRSHGVSLDSRRGGQGAAESSRRPRRSRPSSTRTRRHIWGVDAITPALVDALVRDARGSTPELDMRVAESGGGLVGYADVNDGGPSKKRFWIDLRLLPGTADGGRPRADRTRWRRGRGSGPPMAHSPGRVRRAGRARPRCLRPARVRAHTPLAAHGTVARGGAGGGARLAGGIELRPATEDDMERIWRSRRGRLRRPLGVRARAVRGLPTLDDRAGHRPLAVVSASGGRRDHRRVHSASRSTPATARPDTSIVPERAPAVAPPRAGARASLAALVRASSRGATGASA